MSDGQQTPAWYQQKVAHMFALAEERLAPLAAKRSAQEIARATRALWGGVHGICILAITDNLGVAGSASVQQIAHLLMSNFLKGFIDTAGE
jgi:hypothetical protein